MFTPKSKLNKTIVCGHIVESFDNTLYGFFAVMLAPIFFPPGAADTQLLASYGAFAAGFAARPLGALFFGLIGDTKGRQRPILWSMALVSIPTITIGLIPSYQTLGIISPILLLSCRILQGFCVGGEFSGVNIYNYENGDRSTLGRRTGILISTGVIGAILATSIGAIVSMEVMPAWAWRIPFLFGGCMAITSYLLRRQIRETEEYVALQSNNQVLSNPWHELLANYKLPLVLATIIAGLTLIPLYCSTILGNQIFKELGYSTSQSMSLNTFAMLFDVVVIIACGKLADFLGFHRQMLMGTSLLAFVAFPAFYIISGGHTTTLDIFSFIVILILAGGLIVGCAMPYVAQFFPTNCRYSAMASSVTIGYALFGGTTPLVCSYLQLTLQSRLAPALWLFTIASITTLGVYLFGHQDTKRSRWNYIFNNKIKAHG